MNRADNYQKWILGICLLAAGTLAQADSGIALRSGQPAAFTLPGGSLTTSYYLDVDAAARELVVDLNGHGGGDVDLFLRYGSPFPDPATTAVLDEDLINRYAHYHAFSAAETETLTITQSNRVPLSAGRWYLAVVNASNISENATLTATVTPVVTNASIQIDFDNPGSASSDPCDTTPWNDPTAVAAVSDNPGTTLGQQRRNALLQAAALLSQQLQTPVAVTVRACWDHLGGDSHRAILAHAGATSLLLDLPESPSSFLPQKYTWYAVTEAVRLGGTRACGLEGGPCDSSGEEIEATFNSDIGTAAVLGGEPFYFGYSADTAVTSADFISIAMHEMTHGLGFLGLANLDSTQGPIGAKAGLAPDPGNPQQFVIGYQDLQLGPFDAIFDNAVVSVSPTNDTYIHFDAATTSDAQRASALISGHSNSSAATGLRWSDATAVGAGVNLLHGLPAPDSFPSLYAPNPIAQGSTLSHTVQADDLMNAFYPFPPPRSMGLALPMLAALGWSNAPAPAPVYTQPIPSSWFDRTHSGHGADFRRVLSDPVRGDYYFMIFYTFDTSGNPEWYTAQGWIVDGVFTPDKAPTGQSLLRMQYQPSEHRAVVDTTGGGSVIIDFNESANAPACRNADRSGSPLLGVMSWTIGSESGDWCIEPVVDLDQHSIPDFNGDWYGGSDSGWGMDIMTVDQGGSAPFLFAALYYPDAQGKGRWAVAQASAFANGSTLDLEQRNGYCRSCTPNDATFEPVGQISLTLNQPLQNDTTHGGNSVSIDVTYPGGGRFTRTNAPITLISTAPATQ